MRDKLYNIYREINSRSNSFAKGVQNRLTVSLENYQEELNDTISYLLRKSNLSVFRGIIRTFKEDE